MGGEGGVSPLLPCALSLCARLLLGAVAGPPQSSPYPCSQVSPGAGPLLPCQPIASSRCTCPPPPPRQAPAAPARARVSLCRQARYSLIPPTRAARTHTHTHTGISTEAMGSLAVTSQRKSARSQKPNINEPKMTAAPASSTQNRGRTTLGRVDYAAGRQPPADGEAARRCRVDFVSLLDSGHRRRWHGTSTRVRVEPHVWRSEHRRGRA